MKIRLAGLVNDSIVDGPGYRFSVFVQGCPHRCEGCQNPQTHDFGGGYEGDTDEILQKIRRNPLVSGVTFSGGEPFMQAGPLLDLARKIKADSKLSLWVYSGFTYEELLKKAETDPAVKGLLATADVLIDGRFEISQRDISLPFRGSRNQRIIELHPAKPKDQKNA